MNRSVTVLCPYCGHKVRVDIEDDIHQKTVATCDMEDGGCDRDFVVDAWVSIDAKALKIEGEDKKHGDG